jgi:hypothetical protein
VEWHKKEYFAACKRLERELRAYKVKRFFYRVAGRTPAPQRWFADDLTRMQEYRAALLESGYLSQQSFVLTNSSMRQGISEPRIRVEAKTCLLGTPHDNGPGRDE